MIVINSFVDNNYKEIKDRLQSIFVENAEITNEATEI